MDDDTIVAISTPPGKGGIGALRLSGPRAIAIASSLFRAATTTTPSRPTPPHTTAPGPAPRGAPAAEPGAESVGVQFGRLVSAAGEPIDHGYLLTLHPPRTFTGEESAEIWAHGSPAVLRLLIEEAVALGARPATPGEFSLRAFLNGRIDATQAEAIRDLIEARTAFQVKVAHDQVMGRITRAVERIKDRLAETLARLEATIEFSDEPEAVRFLPEGGILSEVRAVRLEMEGLAGTYERGRRVRDGATIAIIGSPNVGKSSLFNRLLEEERAIVTPVPGTTRDLIEETLDLRGIPVTLVDTAGLHAPRDEADAEAIRRARRAFSAADLALVVLDWSRPIGDEERDLLRGLDEARALVVLNKVDLPCGVGMDRVLYLRKRHAALEVSALSKEGIEGLRRRLAEVVGAGSVASREETFLTNVRHRDLLLKGAASLMRAEGAARDGAGAEYLALDLREGLDRLGEITGEVGVESIYGRIFKNFCIGK
ncbi:MAG TPA: tRNA uridine-5-carboxymethylaminomethyl(34) synthesis GTPase MnmE [Candidatus Polarisedimenticolia bacterium]|nr:tRNA uridine-5-carboxymethylaminomethyl(34) synthesis GTPase MnmE [Candidatus Polarisedimenticolia bacterium]